MQVNRSKHTRAACHMLQVLISMAGFEYNDGKEEERKGFAH